jgi:hypothetical protein
MLTAEPTNVRMFELVCSVFESRLKFWVTWDRQLGDSASTERNLDDCLKSLWALLSSLLVSSLSFVQRLLSDVHCRFVVVLDLSSICPQLLARKCAVLSSPPNPRGW